jgi:RecA-family ATPase
LQAVFNEGDHVSIDTGKPSDSDKPRLSAGETKTREEWVDYILDGNSFSDAIGVYVRVNPMKPGGSKADDVADYRSTLIEFDDIPKGQQYALYLRSGLPIRTITDSGGDSLHAIVAIDAKDAEQYKQRVEIVRSLFANYNPDKTIDAARYSRLAGFDRPAYKASPAGRQTLIAVQPNSAKSWVDWEREQPEAPEFDQEHEDSPQIISLAACMSEVIPEPPKLIHGVLYRGGKLVFGGPPKIGKTWVLMYLALSVANGATWLGKQCDQGRVLYLNFELGKFSNQKRWDWMLKSKEVGTGNIDLRQMKGSAADISKIVDQCIYLARRNRVYYDLIILDPIYKAYDGRDENSAGDMAQVLNELDRLIKELDTSVAFAAHFPKGNLSGRTAMDRISGSGVFARDPEAIVTMTPWEKQADDAFRCDVDWTVRDFPDVASIVVKKEFPLYEVDSDPPVKDSKHSVQDILFILEYGPKSSGALESTAQETLGMTRNAFDNLLKQAKDSGLIEKTGGQKGKWALTAKGKDFQKGSQQPQTPS